MQEKCWKDNRMNLNRSIILIFLIIFSHQSWTKADDIRDFEIEGMSIGDSLLDYFTKNEIMKGKRNYYKNKKYTPIEINSNNFKTFKDLSFSYKTNDKNYIIERMSGYIDYTNKDIKDCYEQIDIVANEIENIFSSDVSRSKKKKEIFYAIDKTGKSNYEYINFNFKNYDQIVVACYNFSIESGHTDNLNVEIKTDQFNKFLAIAY